LSRRSASRVYARGNQYQSVIQKRCRVPLVAETGSGYLDAFDPGLDRGSSDFDVRHRVVANFIWEIPGRPISSRGARHAVEGWEVSGFLSYQTGQPFSLSDLGTPDGTGERTRPRLTGPLPRTTLISRFAFEEYIPLPSCQSGLRSGQRVVHG
jgi:hypothetical protein